MRLVRLAFAVLLASLIFAILIPNMGKVVVDRSTRPPTLHVTQLPQQIAALAAIVLPALAGIFVGLSYASLRWMEPVGWGVLIILFILSTLG